MAGCPVACAQDAREAATLAERGIREVIAGPDARLWLAVSAVVAGLAAAVRIHSAFLYAPLYDFDGPGHALNVLAIHRGRLPDGLRDLGRLPPAALLRARRPGVGAAARGGARACGAAAPLGRRRARPGRDRLAHTGSLWCPRPTPRSRAWWCSAAPCSRSQAICSATRCSAPFSLRPPSRASWRCRGKSPTTSDTL